MKIKPVLIVVLIILSVLMMGCQTPYKEDVFFSTRYLKGSNFYYDEETNMSSVKFFSDITNSTLYNISGYHLKMKITKEDDLSFSVVEVFEVDQKFLIIHGTTEQICCVYSFEGKHDDFDEYGIYGKHLVLEYIQGAFEFKSVFSTYLAWFVFAFVMLALFISAYIYFGLKITPRYGQFFMALIEYIRLHSYLKFILCLPLFYFACKILPDNLFPIVIIFGLIVAIILSSFLVWLTRKVAYSIGK